jgi:hypothetical protein
VTAEYTTDIRFVTCRQTNFNARSLAPGRREPAICLRQHALQAPHGGLPPCRLGSLTVERGIDEGQGEEKTRIIALLPQVPSGHHFNANLKRSREVIGSQQLSSSMYRSTFSTERYCPIVPIFEKSEQTPPNRSSFASSFA